MGQGPGTVSSPGCARPPPSGGLIATTHPPGLGERRQRKKEEKTPTWAGWLLQQHTPTVGAGPPGNDLCDTVRSCTDLTPGLTGPPNSIAWSRGFDGRDGGDAHSPSLPEGPLGPEPPPRFSAEGPGRGRLLWPNALPAPTPALRRYSGSIRPREAPCPRGICTEALLALPMAASGVRGALPASVGVLGMGRSLGSDGRPGRRLSPVGLFEQGRRPAYASCCGPGPFRRHRTCPASRCLNRLEGTDFTPNLLSRTPP